MRSGRSGSSRAGSRTPSSKASTPMTNASRAAPRKLPRARAPRPSGRSPGNPPMEITARMVNDLRQQTGAGMMECKAALKEANGDPEEATKILRKKGLAAAAKKAGRSATEGLVSAKVHPQAAVLLEVNCETDFVAKTEQ